MVKRRGNEMKTRITFEMKNKTQVDIMRDGKKIGEVWSEGENETLPYPHEDKNYCHNSIQLCGFDKLDGPWGCGPFEGKRDLVVHFRDDTGEYMQQKAKEYGEYVQNFFNAKARAIITGKETIHIAKMEAKGDFSKLMNFDDWFRSGRS